MLRKKIRINHPTHSNKGNNITISVNTIKTSFLYLLLITAVYYLFNTLYLYEVEKNKKIDLIISQLENISDEKYKKIDLIISRLENISDEKNIATTQNVVSNYENATNVWSYINNILPYTPHIISTILIGYTGYKIYQGLSIFGGMIPYVGSLSPFLAINKAINVTEDFLSNPINYLLQAPVAGQSYSPYSMMALFSSTTKYLGMHDDIPTTDIEKIIKVTSDSISQSIQNTSIESIITVPTTSLEPVAESLITKDTFISAMELMKEITFY